MNANPNLTICFFNNQNGGDIFDKTPSRECGQRLKHAKIMKQHKGGKVILTVTDCKNP